MAHVMMRPLGVRIREHVASSSIRSGDGGRCGPKRDTTRPLGAGMRQLVSTIRGGSTHPMFIAGMLLVSLVWAWSQIDRDRVVRRAAACVHDRARLGGMLVDRAVVLDCYSNGNWDEHRDD